MASSSISQSMSQLMSGSQSTVISDIRPKRQSTCNNPLQTTCAQFPCMLHSMNLKDNLTTVLREWSQNFILRSWNKRCQHHGTLKFQHQPCWMLFICFFYHCTLYFVGLFAMEFKSSPSSSIRHQPYLSTSSAADKGNFCPEVSPHARLQPRCENTSSRRSDIESNLGPAAAVDQ